MRGAFRAAALSLLLLAPAAAFAADPDGGFTPEEEFTFDPSEFEKPPFEWAGFLQLDLTRTGLREDSSLYRLNALEGEGETTVGAAFQPDLTWQDGPWKVFLLASLAGTSRDSGWEDSYTLLEGYASLQASRRISLSAGKVLARWGKGYAFSPVSYISREKNPSDPDLALEGYWMALADAVLSFPGALKTLAFTGAAVPVSGDVNTDFGREEDMNWAGKVYLLWHDTDIDLMAISKGTRTARYGLDFSRNVTSNLEIHGEWSVEEDAVRQVVEPDMSRLTETSDAHSWLAGVRYLTAAETTFIVEFYHNGKGYSEEEARDFYELARSSPEDQLEALRGISAPYQKPNFMKDYLYLRVSQKDPFGWLYVTPGVTSVINVDDGSYNLIPEVVYTGVTNLELRFRVNLLAGDEGTEYGEKPNRWKAEGRARYFF